MRMCKKLFTSFGMSCLFNMTLFQIIRARGARFKYEIEHTPNLGHSISTLVKKI